MGYVQPENTKEKKLISYVNLLHEDQIAMCDVAAKVPRVHTTEEGEVLTLVRC